MTHKIGIIGASGGEVAGPVCLDTKGSLFGTGKTRSLFVTKKKDLFLRNEKSCPTLSE